MIPSKRAFEKYKPRGVFSEFYGVLIEGGTGCGKTKTNVQLSGTGRNKLFSVNM